MAGAVSRALGGFAPLSGNYFFDDRVAEAGPLAELLFVRSLAFCAGAMSDGFMSGGQVRRIVAIGLDDVDDLAKTLVAVGLWERDEARDGYRIRRWLKWNKSREEIERYRARDAARKRGEIGIRPESERIPSTKTRQDKARQDKTRASGRTPPGPVRPEASRDDAAVSPPAPPPDLSGLRAQIDRARRSARDQHRRPESAE
jgi:hypothetical protein